VEIQHKDTARVLRGSEQPFATMEEAHRSGYAALERLSDAHSRSSGLGVPTGASSHRPGPSASDRCTLREAGSDFWGDRAPGFEHLRRGRQHQYFCNHSATASQSRIQRRCRGGDARKTRR
jgi:hypothetical protein